MKNISHAIIIGGTSGIGLALATDYLQRGWQVTVVGSNTNKIEHIKTTLQVTYPSLNVYQCDLNQPAPLESLLLTLSQQPFQVFVYSAGWYLNERTITLNKNDSAAMLSINLQVFQQLFAWASEQLKQLKQDDMMSDKKHLVCLSSIAGMINYKDASLYAQCKNAMISTSQAYRMALQPFGIHVTCIASGYVDTAQLRTLNNGDASHKPFLIDEAQAVQEIQYAIDNNVAVHCFPQQMHRIMSLLAALPKPLLNRLMTWQYRKQDGR